MIYYVNIQASREGDGSRERPFRFINEAAKVAMPGDEVVVAPGVYREYVNPVHAGTEDARITYRSEKPLAAVITGAELLTGWKKVKGTTWTARVDNGVFGTFNPYIEKVEGDWYFSPIVRHTGAVFLNDLMMYECSSLEECEAGKPDPHAWTQEEAKYLWYTEQDGMIGPHWSRGWIIEDCEVSNSRCCGISLGKYLDPENDMYFFHKKVKSPTQMERDAVCRGQYHGWLKEKVGGHIIRRCNVHHCEQTGIVGRMGGVFSTIEDCHIHHICNSQQLGGAETAGIKLHAAIDVTIRRNHIHNCIMGVWLDWEAQGARISQNLMHDNCRPEGREQARGAMFSTDIFIEVGHGPTLIDNNILLSPVSITIPSEGIACVHNLVLGGFSLINSGVDSVVNGQREPRYTPYHIRHRTEVAGFMTILHGDDRIYNNLFIQAYPVTDKERKPTDAEYQVVGTAPFDIFPTYEEWYAPFIPGTKPDMGALAKVHFGHLPVWVEGNAYFNGATVCKHEKHKLSDKRSKVTVILEEKDGKYSLKTNVYSKLKDFTDGIICTETLGQAFEPEQRFENPDGTDIIFNKDYFGNHRGTKTIPGPFASAEDAEKILY